MKNHILLLLLITSISFFAQSEFTVKKDTTTQLNEIIITGRRKLSNYRQNKTLSSIDEYLEKNNQITMIKRGNYAWEPSLNNMVTDRLSVTIDGMQIYGACTDKMDPVTSYVDVSNLEKVSVNSGQQGAENSNCIGGGIDLKLPNSKFYNTGFKTGIDLGYETNGNYKSTGLDLEYSGNKFFISVDGIFRKSDNYKAGKNKEILYSQFQKYNISIQSGYKLAEHYSVEADFIFDEATDVGYPALPMDVSLAKAAIGSLSFIYKNKNTTIKDWETKIYFNSITHIMDDSKRPVVAIRMDMPGWSDTYGMYSKLKFNLKKHQLFVNLNGHYNRSLAEMTMYPNNPNENVMFMYTWPDVKTRYTGIYLKDEYAISKKETLSVSTRFGLHHNRIDNQTGLESLRIFYPEMESSKNRILSSVSSNYTLTKNKFNFDLGIGYGERAPSVSEGYGFYLFNSSDRYDYVGNPDLKNEKAIEANFKASFKQSKFKMGIESNFFHIKNYIIGEIDPSLTAMTIGANGVRIYNAIDYATIFGYYLNNSYQISKALSINTTIGYNYGKGSNAKNLPLIRPFSYFGEINYSLKKFSASLQIVGNGNQTKYGSAYDEDETPAYTTLNINFGNKLTIKKNDLILKYGIENVLDRNYSTYADWNNLPRQGRNFYLNVSYIIL